MITSTTLHGTLHVTPLSLIALYFFFAFLITTFEITVISVVNFFDNILSFPKYCRTKTLAISKVGRYTGILSHSRYLFDTGIAVLVFVLYRYTVIGGIP